MHSALLPMRRKQQPFKKYLLPCRATCFIYMHFHMSCDSGQGMGQGPSQTDPKKQAKRQESELRGFRAPLRDSLWLRAACAGSRGDRIFPAENSGKRARNGHFGLPSQDLVHCGCRKRYHIFLSSRGPAGVGRGRVPSDNRDDRRQTTATSTKRNQCGPQSSGRLMNAGQRRASHRGEVGALAVLGPGPVGIEDR